MNLVTIDFETYYNSKEKYSLRHMTPEEYIRDSRFQIILVGLKFNDRDSFWISGTHEYIAQKLSQIMWDKVVCLGHNISGFDALILTEVLGIRPGFWQDTMCIGRALHGGMSVSLANLAKYYLLGMQKGDYVNLADGKRREDFTEEELAAYGDYCTDDVDICYVLYQIMSPLMPTKELRQVHLFTRMFGEPRLVLDVEGLDLMVKQLQIQKQNLLDRCQVTEKQLRSDAKFADILQSLGVEPGMKQNKKMQWKYAFAKTDPFMKDLQEHPDQAVRLLAAARLKTKTTIEESRAQRFLDIGHRGPLPALLNYGKTLTHRASGGGGINLQNMNQPRAVTSDTLRGALLQTSQGRQTLESYDPATKTVTTQEGAKLVLAPGSADTCHVYGLRDAIRAPEGYVLVACDSSNIELRVAHLLAGQMDTIERIRNGEDLYCWFAEDLYSRPITKADHSERQHGKVGMLQLQFQSGWISLQTAARVMGGIILTPEESQNTVDMFRNKFPELPKTWYRCQDAISDMYYGRQKYIDQWGLCYTEHNTVVLPNGLRLIYNNLRHEYDDEYGWQWVYDDKETRKPKKIYGGALFANMVQALARIVVFDQTLTIEKRWGGPDTGVALIVHDETVTVVREPDAVQAEHDILTIMSQPPKWWPQLPVNAEAGVAVSYGDAK